MLSVIYHAHGSSGDTVVEWIEYHLKKETRYILNFHTSNIEEAPDEGYELA